MFIERCILVYNAIENILAGPSEIKSIKVSNEEGGLEELGILPGSDGYNALSDTTLFSSSLPVLPHGKCKLKLMDCDCFSESLTHCEIFLVLIIHFLMHMQ